MTSNPWRTATQAVNSVWKNRLTSVFANVCEKAGTQRRLGILEDTHAVDVANGA